MLLRTPDFYQKFHCIADKCTDSCCIGWEIDIDSATQEKYKAAENSPGINRAFAKKLHNSICDGHFVLTDGDRCPFLDKCGLCEIYKNLGEGALCDICREHPRFVEVYGDIKEQGIGLCCEEGVRLLLEESNAANSAAPSVAKNAAPKNANSAAPIIQFVESEVDDIPDELPSDAREARNQIFAERDNMFAILSQREIPLNKRLQMLLEYAIEVSGINEEVLDNDVGSSAANTPAEKCANNTTDIATNSVANTAKIRRTWIEILGKGESFGPAWDKAYKAISENGDINLNDVEKSRRAHIFSDEDGAKIVAYMLFRYYAKSLFDGDSLGKVQFAIFFWIVLREFGQELAGISESETPAADPKIKTIDPRIAAVKLLSKQVEYSDEVMELLADAFADDEAFSVESFFKLLGN